MPTLLVLVGAGDSRGGSAGTYLPVYITAVPEGSCEQLIFEFLDESETVTTLSSVVLGVPVL